jgi:hypothetical protein
MIKWLQTHMGTCAFKEHTGMDCPGCGMQRSFVELLKGNIWESIHLYPGLIPIIFTIIYLILHLTFSFKNGAKVLKISFIFTAIVIVVTYIIKIVNNYHFIIN